MTTATAYALRVVCTGKGTHKRTELAMLHDRTDLGSDDPAAWADADIAATIQGRIGELPRVRQGRRPGTARTRRDGGITYWFSCPRCRLDAARREEWVEKLFDGCRAAGVSSVDASRLGAY